MKLGIQIIPTMPVAEVIETIRVAEGLGYDFALLADEGFMPDVYVSLGAAALRTQRIRLGPVTNGYTRHPAVTAVALASLNELSGGRALVALVAGGTVVLPPMGIEREAPLTVVRETLEVMRRLWTGEAVTWQGQRYRLENARLAMGAHSIPIWLAVRGDKLLALAGREADGVLLMAKSDLGQATAIVAAAAGRRARPLERIYLDRPAYTPALMGEAAYSFAFAFRDAPERMLHGLGLTEAEIAQLREAIRVGGPAAAVQWVTPEMLSRFQLAGTPAECAAAWRELAEAYQMGGFTLNLITSGLADNTRLMEETRSIVLG